MIHTNRTIFVDESRGTEGYFIKEGEHITCDICGKKLKGPFILQTMHKRWSYNQIVSEEYVFCFPQCGRRPGYMRLPCLMVEARMILQVEVIPPLAIPYFPRMPDLGTAKGGEISVFEAAKLESEHTVDNTMLAGRESWEGAKIGRRMDDEDCFRELDEKTAKKILDFHTGGKNEHKAICGREMQNRRR